MKHSLFIGFCLWCLFGGATAIAQTDDIKMAEQAKNMIGKTDAASKKINSLKSLAAIKYCAKQAGIITQSESNSYKESLMLDAKDTRPANLTRIPKGHLIGFIKAGRLVHCMVSTGNGKAIGTYNKLGIGLGADRIWQEISLQAIPFNKNKGSFTLKGRDYVIVHESVSTVFKGQASQQATSSNSSSFNEKKELHTALDKYKWSRMSGTLPHQEYEKHREGFPEFVNWEQYAAKSNDMLRTMSRTGSQPTFSNKNIIAIIYNEIFLFDKKDLIVLQLDTDRLPATMFRVKSLGAYYDYVHQKINWRTTSTKRDPIQKIKKEFSKYGKDLNYRTWYEYGYAAQLELENIAQRSKTDKNLLVGRHNGNLIVYNKKKSTFVTADQQNRVITMFKHENGEDEFMRIVEEKYNVKDPEQLDETISSYGTVSSQANEYESVDAVLESGIVWSQESDFQQEFQTYRNDFRQLQSAQEYINLANSLIERYSTAKVDDNSETAYKNKHLRVKKYGSYYYCYDKDKKLFLKLDKEQLPLTMYKMNSESSFKKAFSDVIKWGKLGNLDQEEVAKKEFAENGKKYSFETWEAYAFYAENLLVDIRKKAASNRHIHFKKAGTVYYYYNEKTNDMMQVSRDMKVMTLYQPESKYEHFEDMVNSGKARSKPGNVQIDESKNTVHEYEPEEGLPATPPHEPDENLRPTNSAYGSVADLPPTPPEEPEEDGALPPLPAPPEPYDEEGQPVQAPPEPSETGPYGAIGDEAFADYDPSTNYTDAERYSPTDWAPPPGSKMPARNAALLAYKKQRSSFQGASVKQYIAAAHNFYIHRPVNVEVKTLANSDIVLYHAPGNLLGVYTSEGVPRKFMKPKAGRVGFDSMK